MELITGKNKKQFIKFLKNLFKGAKWKDEILWDWFINLPFEMKIGVYLAYYDSLWLEIEVRKVLFEDDIFWSADIWEDLKLKGGINKAKTRNEAYKEAFKKADKIINKN